MNPNKSLSRFPELTKCSVVLRKGTNGANRTKEERQLKKVELVAVPAPPGPCLQRLLGGQGKVQRERRGKNIVHQLSIALED